eukprot:COSAG01_NODE_52_length_31456_cov_125.226648_14_plen_119_part_00
MRYEIFVIDSCFVSKMSVYEAVFGDGFRVSYFFSSEHCLSRLSYFRRVDLLIIEDDVFDYQRSLLLRQLFLCFPSCLFYLLLTFDIDVNCPLPTAYHDYLTYPISHEKLFMVKQKVFC